LVHSPAFFQEVVDQIKLLQSAGKDIQRIVIADHFSAAGSHGCAAYGRDDSRARHTENLHAAARQLKGVLPHLKIELLLQDIDGDTVEQIGVYSAE
jgi:hypothetical protein